MSFYLDACVIVALVQNEAGTEAAIKFVSQAEKPLIASAFALGETAAAISRQFRTGKIDLRDAEDRLADLDEWVAASIQPISTEARDIAAGAEIVRQFKLGLRLPDAIHVGAARARDMTLVTLDKAMARAARELGVEVIEPD